ncbi:MAG TPA: Holliday junction resolvase RuvX [Spongiibacteraceae bacterium]|nr:Holliday junction resolvase RuvX [Spongiibacteraceae bacterium]HCS29169.1 Holliday junction resolvase RuvX [Spongiibacteraceae bacterium]
MSKPSLCVLGFDYGTRWIGVATGQTLLGTASALKPLMARDGIPDWDEIGQLIGEWQPDVVVIGLPLNMDGSPSELSQRAGKFGRRLNGRFGVEVEYWDERLSSFEAKGEIMTKRHSKNFKREAVDSLSAQLILESWMRSRPA